MLIFKLLHILAMFAAVALLVGESTFMAIAIWRGDVRALAAIRRVLGGRPVVAAAIFMVGIGFGVLTVATGGLDFFAGWLIAAYVMVVVLLAINALPVVQKGLLGLIERATEAEAGQRTAEEVAGEMAAFRFRFSLVVAANWLLFAAIIADMVLKPL
jgi:uncharacterized membrane protein